MLVLIAGYVVFAMAFYAWACVSAPLTDQFDELIVNRDTEILELFPERGSQKKAA